MLGFANLHVLTVRHGEVYVHHFWLLAFLAYVCLKASVSVYDRKRR